MWNAQASTRLGESLGAHLHKRRLKAGRWNTPDLDPHDDKNFLVTPQNPGVSQRNRFTGVSRP